MVRAIQWRSTSERAKDEAEKKAHKLYGELQHGVGQREEISDRLPNDYHHEPKPNHKTESHLNPSIQSTTKSAKKPKKEARTC